MKIHLHWLNWNWPKSHFFTFPTICIEIRLEEYIEKNPESQLIFSRTNFPREETPWLLTASIQNRSNLLAVKCFWLMQLFTIALSSKVSFQLWTMKNYAMNDIESSIKTTWIFQIPKFISIQLWCNTCIYYIRLSEHVHCLSS